MNNEELTKIAWTRELTDERVRVAVAYWLDCSPHERIEADGIILARYAREVMVKLADQKAIIELAVKGLTQANEVLAELHSQIAQENNINPSARKVYLSKIQYAGETVIAQTIFEIERLQNK